MEKVTMYRTSDGQLFGDADEADAHEKAVARINNFKQRYEDCTIYGENSVGRVDADQLIWWARDNTHAFQALCSAVLRDDK